MNNNLKKSFLKKNNSKIIPNALNTNFWRDTEKKIKGNIIGYVLTEKNSLLKGTDLAYQISFFCFSLMQKYNFNVLQFR